MSFNNIHLEQIQFLESILFEAVGQEIRVNGYELLSGGNINTALRIQSDKGPFFVKWNEQAESEMFVCEAKGLQLLQNTGPIRIPEVFGCGQKAQKAYLLLEYIPLARPRKHYWQQLGQQLSILHAHTNAFFGLEYDNYLGHLRQSNEPFNNGIDFFIERRLKVQAGLAYYNGLLPQRQYEQFFSLYEKLPTLLPDEKPSLLHGDLWSGNVLVDHNGEPCLIDPAVYYGLREAELAFTRLFGGFAEAFYQSYQEAMPINPGFAERIELYNLYPLLVHLNLFGSGYLPGIEKVLKKYS